MTLSIKDKALISGQIDMTSTIEEDIKVLKNKLKKHGTGLDACNCTSCYNSRMRLPILERWLATSKAKDKEIAELKTRKRRQGACFGEVGKRTRILSLKKIAYDRKKVMSEQTEKIKSLEIENKRLKKRLEVRI